MLSLDSPGVQTTDPWGMPKAPVPVAAPTDPWGAPLPAPPGRSPPVVHTSPPPPTADPWASPAKVPATTDPWGGAVASSSPSQLPYPSGKYRFINILQ